MTLSQNILSYSAVIFDMDGLLIDTEFYVLQAFTNLCEQLGIHAEMTVLHKCIGANREATNRILETELKGAGNIQTFRLNWEAEYRRLTAAKASLLKDGALELLHYLKETGSLIGLATSTDTEHALARLEKERIRHFFDEITGGDQVLRSKPAPDIYLMAAQKFNVPPENCLALEDSENGVRAALAAGMQVIQVPDIVQPNACFRALGHTILPSLISVIPHMETKFRRW
jgi:HAD superfamily hydrolase (TIGR01509 family)